MLTSVRLRLKLAEPVTSLNMSRLLRSPATVASGPFKIRPASARLLCLQSRAVAPMPDAWFSWIMPLVRVALTPGATS